MALDIFASNRNYVEKIMQQENLDALLLPISTHGSATYDLETLNTSIAALSSNSGLPAIEFIAGYTNNKIPMPVGMEFIGKMYGEAELFAMAYAYEQLQKRKAPNLGQGEKRLQMFSIPELNNLWTVIGYQSYQQVLKNSKPKDLTAAKFNEIVKGVSE